MIRASLLLRPAAATTAHLRYCNSANSILKLSDKITPRPSGKENFSINRFCECLVTLPKHKMRSRVFWRYLALGIGTLGVGYMGFNSYHASEGTREDKFKLFVTSTVAAGIGYIGARYFQIAFCESPRIDKLDEVLYDAHKKSEKALKEWTEKAEEALEEAKRKTEEAMDDLKGHVDQKKEELWELVKEKYVSKTMEEAIDLITDILENVKDFANIEVKEGLRAPIFIPLAMIMVAQGKRAENWIKDELMVVARQTEKDREKFELHKRLGKFALDVYDAAWEGTKEKQAKVFGLSSPDDILYTWFTDDYDADHCPKFAVIVDREHERIVLAIRGTQSLQDAIIDAICDEEPFLDGFAHKGILKGAKRVISLGLPVIKDALKANPGYKLLITGHSLGAGTSELVTLELMMGSEHSLPKGTEIECVVLAPPPIYRPANKDKALPKRVRDAIDIYINGQDCVPRMSLATLMKVISVARAVDAIEMTAYEQVQMIMGTLAGMDETTPAIKENLGKVQKVISEIDQDRFPFLEHPGKIHFLFPSHGKESFLKSAFLFCLF